mgnify:CR=1 FL=1|tara:strand:- start:2692 stop:3255 length:564 start_codon:yes stop_codon:yes gene_type:complete
MSSSSRLKPLDIFTETNVFSYQYPGNYRWGPPIHIGEPRHSEACFSCSRIFRGNYFAIANSPGISYLGRDPESEQVYIIPYALIKCCPECVTRNKNIFMKCSGCSCYLVPDVDYRIDADLKIFCEYCVNSYHPEHFQNTRNFQVSFYSSLGETDSTTIQEHWRNLEKYPLEKSNPFVQSLLESHQVE